MKSEPINIETFTINDIACITGEKVKSIREKLKRYTDLDRLPRGIEFNKRDLFKSGILGFTSSSENAYNMFEQKIQCCKTILKSQVRATEIFNNPTGIKTIKFPPALSFYEKILSETDKKRIIDSWERKHLYLYGNKSENYIKHIQNK